MKITSLYIFLITTFIYLSTGKDINITTSQKETTLDTTTISQKFSILDSLKKFGGGKDTLLIDDVSDATLFIGRTNNKNFGVYVVSDKSLALNEQNDKDKWVKSSTIRYNFLFSFATCEDINGDNLNDIIISSISGAAGNTEDIVFIYDKTSGMFKHNKSYDLTNISYDKEGKFVRSSWFAGVVHCQTKMKYRISGNDLILDFGIFFCPDENDGKTATITYFNMKNNKRFIVDSLSGNSEQLWLKFEREIWNSEHDIVD